MADLDADLSSIDKEQPQHCHLLPFELLNELLICLPCHHCSGLLSASSVVYNLLSRNKRFRRWRQKIRQQKTKLIRLAEKAQEDKDYEYMTVLMKKVVNLDIELTFGESRLLFDAYEKLCNAKRDQCNAKRDQWFMKERTAGVSLFQEQREELNGQVRKIYVELIGLLEEKLIPKAAGEPELKLRYLIEKATNQTSLAMYETDDKKRARMGEAEKSYEEALTVAVDKMRPVHPTRLKASLCFAIFYHDYMGSPEKACELAEKAVSAAEQEWDDKVKPILEQFRKNLDIWKREGLGVQAPIGQRSASLAEVPAEQAEQVAEDGAAAAKRRRMDEQDGAGDGPNPPSGTA